MLVSAFAHSHNCTATSNFFNLFIYFYLFEKLRYHCEIEEGANLLILKIKVLIYMRSNFQLFGRMTQCAADSARQGILIKFLVRI